MPARIAPTGPNALAKAVELDWLAMKIIRIIISYIPAAWSSSTSMAGLYLQVVIWSRFGPACRHQGRGFGKAQQNQQTGFLSSPRLLASHLLNSVLRFAAGNGIFAAGDRRPESAPATTSACRDRKAA